MKLKPIATLLFVMCAATGFMTSPLSVAANDADQAPAYSPINIANDQGLTLRLPKDEIVVYRGVVSFDKAGKGPGMMMYPTAGLGAAGLLVGVITHGLISESSKNSQKEKIQTEANAVLAPYKEVLSTFTYKDLMSQGLEKAARPLNKRVIENSENPQTGWLVISAPIFSMTQDRRAIVLDNVIGIYAHDSMDAPKYQTVIRVISQAKDESEVEEYWSGNQGEKLKAESVALFTQSLDIAIHDAETDPTKNNAAHKTFRYFEGGQEKMERAQLIKEGCKRNLIRTLRGGLISVPAQASAGSEKCMEISSNK
jgi:hypothetical protein